MSQRFKVLIFVFIVSAVNTYYSMNQNFRVNAYHYNSEMWADKAGYYMYLPATFIYHWDAKNVPDSMEQKIGLGFRASIKDDYIYSKYPPGPAILELPTFLLCHGLVSLIAPENADGFTQPYHFTHIFTIHLYLFLALYLLSLLCLKYGHNLDTIIPLILVLIFGTNYWYGAIWQPCMSHLYSFVLISFLLYAIHLKKDKTYWLKIGLLLGLNGSIRIVNLFLLMALVIHFYDYFKSDKNKIKAVAQTITGITIGLIPLALHKYHEVSNDLIAYENEGFPYLLNPRIDAILWSPTNGIFIFTPVLGFIFLYILYQLIKTKKTVFIMSFIIFLGISYIYGSWWCSTMGCYLGHRSYVDFLPIFFFPFIINPNFKLKRWIWILIILSCIYTSYLAFAYPGCLDDGIGANPWKWSEYMRLWLR